MSRGAYWSGAMLGTIADHTTIRPGDLLFFFEDREIYGIGRVIDPYGGRPASRGVLLNYAGSLKPDPATPTGAALDKELDRSYWTDIRLAIPFVPAPQFFAKGIDMDEVLSSPGAEAAWGLRFWERANFKQLGEDETQLLLRVFLRRFGNGPTTGTVPARSEHDLRASFDPRRHVPFLMGDMVADSPQLYVDDRDMLRHEYVLHGLLVEALDPPGGISGDLWHPLRLDVYREVAASPPKPPIWRDSIDVMGTRRFDAASQIGIHYELVEAKRGVVPYASQPQTFDAIVTQLMKYVDFVAEHYAGGNYSAVSALYVAYDYRTGISSAWSQEKTNPTAVTTRSYVLNPRESPPTRSWNAVRLLKYRWLQSERRIQLQDA